MMSYLQKLLLLLVTLAVSFIAPASAKNGRYALVIGNSNYASVGSLANPVGDARAVRKAFERLGFTVVYGENLTRQQSIEQISTFLEQKEKIRVAAFYYAGHGIAINGENFIIPVDADFRKKSSLDDNVISMNRLLAFMDEHSETSLIFLDACRDNPFKKQIKQGISRGLTQLTRNLGQFDLMSVTAKGKRFSVAPSRRQGFLRRGKGRGKRFSRMGKRAHAGRFSSLSPVRKPASGERKYGRTRAGKPEGPASFPVRSLRLGTGLAEIGGKTGMFISFATAPGTVAYDGNNQHSPFTEGLLKYIGEKVEINLVATRIRNHVNRITNGLQVPWSSSSLTREIYLASLPREQGPQAGRSPGRNRLKRRSGSRLNKKASLKPPATRSKPARRSKTKSKRSGTRTKSKVRTRKTARSKSVRSRKTTSKRTKTRKTRTVARSTTRSRKSPVFLP